MLFLLALLYALCLCRLATTYDQTKKPAKRGSSASFWRSSLINPAAPWTCATVTILLIYIHSLSFTRRLIRDAVCLFKIRNGFLPIVFSYSTKSIPFSFYPPFFSFRFRYLDAIYDLGNSLHDSLSFFPRNLRKKVRLGLAKDFFRSAYSTTIVR